MLGSCSTPGRLLNRYEVITHAVPGFVNDPNDWACKVGNPPHTLGLIGKVTTVSVEINRIVAGLAGLIVGQRAPTSWFECSERWHQGGNGKLRGMNAQVFPWYFLWPSILGGYWSLGREGGGP